jgi:cytochrome c-type biogenesis protein CcmF
MILGYTLIALALGLTVAANVLFAAGGDYEKRRELLTRWAKRATLASAACIVGASAYLVYLIANHHFEVAYVAEYSARRSSSRYLLAAFWGGQEGSLLLWEFWGAVLGAVLAYKAGLRVRKVWPIYGIVQIFLLTLLLMKCPFALGEGPTPADGRGLNPLLENQWMVIHPPLLFLGFSALMPVFAWCVYGLVYRDWDGWAKCAFSWALFAFATLGFGLSLGGYWAYETLGWGGFWAWDPVENSSLVPWVTITALLHGIAIQNKNGGYKITNFILGFTPFAYMIWGTFLTRTGLLSDFSVHSFSSLGTSGYWALLVGVVSATFIPLGLLVWRAKSIPKPPAYEKVVSREFGYFLASALLGLIGLITAVGMSAPLITKIWMTKGAAAQPDFYNQATYPLALILTVAMAATPYMTWKAAQKEAIAAKDGSTEGEKTEPSELESLGKRLLPPYIVTLLLTMGMTAAAFFFGVRKPLMVLLFATSVFAVIANAWLIVPRMKHRSGRKSVGGFIAHMGAGMVLAGVACLVAFTQSAERVMLIKDVPVQRLGYTFTYKGQTKQPYDRANGIAIEVRKGKYVWQASPSYYLAPWDNKDTVFANPPGILPSSYNIRFPDGFRAAAFQNFIYDVASLMPWNNPYPAGDLYVALNSEPAYVDMGLAKGPNQGFTLGPNEVKTVGDYTFFLRDLSFDEKAQALFAKGEQPQQVFVQATVDVTYKGETATATTKLRLQPNGGVYALPAQIPGPTGSQVMLKLEQPGEDQKEPLKVLTLRTLNAPDPAETVLVDVSTKPMIGLVWLGTLLYTWGGLVAYRRRALEAGLIGAKETEGEASGNETNHPQTPQAPKRKPSAKSNLRQQPAQTKSKVTL